MYLIDICVRSRRLLSTNSSSERLDALGSEHRCGNLGRFRFGIEETEWIVGGHSKIPETVLCARPDLGQPNFAPTKDMR